MQLILCVQRVELAVIKGRAGVENQHGKERASYEVTALKPHRDFSAALKEAKGYKLAQLLSLAHHQSKTWFSELY